jgi:hypothetical protein
MNAGVPIQTPEPDPFRAESMAFWRKQIIAVDGILAGL